MSTEEKKPEGKKELSAETQKILDNSPLMKVTHEFSTTVSETMDKKNESMIVIACDKDGKMVTNVIRERSNLIKMLSASLHAKERPLYKLVLTALELNEFLDEMNSL